MGTRLRPTRTHGATAAAAAALLVALALAAWAPIPTRAQPAGAPPTWGNPMQAPGGGLPPLPAGVGALGDGMGPAMGAPAARAKAPAPGGGLPAMPAGVGSAAPEQRPEGPDGLIHDAPIARAGGGGASGGAGGGPPMPDGAGEGPAMFDLPAGMDGLPMAAPATTTHTTATTSPAAATPFGEEATPTPTPVPVPSGDVDAGGRAGEWSSHYEAVQRAEQRSEEAAVDVHATELHSADIRAAESADDGMGDGGAYDGASEGRVVTGREVEPLDLNGPMDERLVEAPVEEGGVRSKSTTYTVRFKKVGDELIFKQAVLLDSGELNAITFIRARGMRTEIHIEGPAKLLGGHDRINLNMDAAQQESIAAQEKTVEARTSPVWSGSQLVAESYQLRQPRAGAFSVVVKALSGTGSGASDTGAPAGYLVVHGASDVHLYTHLSTSATLVGEPVGVVAYVYDPAGENYRRVVPARCSTRHAVVSDAFMVAMGPDGHQSPTIKMARQKDGKWYAEFVPKHAGPYLVKVITKGKSMMGIGFTRSAEHFFKVHHPVTFGDHAVGKFLDFRHSIVLNVPIQIPAEVAVHQQEHPHHQLHYRVYFELHGTAPGGLHEDGEHDDASRAVPVAWATKIAKLKPSKKSPTKGFVTMEVDLRWVHRARAVEPFVLHNVRVEEMESYVPVGRIAHMPLSLVGDLPPAPSHAIHVLDSMFARNHNYTVDTAELGDEAALLQLREARTTTTSSSTSHGASASTSSRGGVPHEPVGSKRPSLLLVHGVCESDHVWDESHFQGASIVRDANNMRTIDHLARVIHAHAHRIGAAAFSVVAHGEGALAALHLFTFYESGLRHSHFDAARRPGRPIQAIGAPFQGSSFVARVASMSTSLGEEQCGTLKHDLTPAGTRRWLAGIPYHHRARVFYWTTSVFLDPNSYYSSCNYGADPYLLDPEDGAVERIGAQLPGGHAGSEQFPGGRYKAAGHVHMPMPAMEGHYDGLCHADGMQDPSQTKWKALNAHMSNHAARTARGGGK